MRFIRNFFLALYNIHAAIWFIAIMFLILPGIFLVSLFGKIRGGNMVFYFLRFWAHTWFPLVGIWFKRIRYEAEDKDPVIYVANHLSYLDAAIAVKVMRLPFRPLGKIEMVKIPAFGFIYRQSVVLVDRKDARARAQSVRTMKATLKEGVSMLVFPEGTTNYTGQPLRHFHDGAFRMAIEMETDIRPVLYVDSNHRLRAKGLLSLTPGINRVVWLPKVSVKGLTLADLPALKKQVYDMMDTELRKYHNYPSLQPA